LQKLEGLLCGHGVDWWALGIMVFDMWTGCLLCDCDTEGSTDDDVDVEEEEEDGDGGDDENVFKKII
jgi:hypothetical protein